MIGDDKGVPGEGIQDPAGVFEELEGLATSVGDDGGDLQVPHPVDVVEGRGLVGAAETVAA